MMPQNGNSSPLAGLMGVDAPPNPHDYARQDQIQQLLPSDGPMLGMSHQGQLMMSSGGGQQGGQHAWAGQQWGSSFSVFPSGGAPRAGMMGGHWGAPQHMEATRSPSAQGGPRRCLLEFYQFASDAQGRKIKLGGGNFATVWKGISRSCGEEVAIKIILKSDSSGNPPAEANPLHAEILKMVDHKNIIQLKDYFDEEKALFLVLELATGGDILHKVSSDGVFNEESAVRYCRQILTALAHCHKRGLVHCDLKCENILFSSKTQDANAELKLADFGLAQLVKQGDKLMSGRGTPEYVAPEVIEATGYDSAADMWSVGILVYTWLSGVFPFYAPDKDEMKNPIPVVQQREILFAKIRDCQYSEKYIENVSREAKDFIRCLLKKDPQERWTAEQCLEHPWIASNTLAVKPLNHNLQNLRKQNRVREQEGTSHAFYSVLLNSSQTSMQTPLLVAATTAPVADEMDIMGRGVSPLITLAFSTHECDQLQAAGMLANYLLKREYLDRLVDGGVFRALCHLSESSNVGVLNFVGLALYRIAQVKVHRSALGRNEQCVSRIIALGKMSSNMLARQAGRSICELLKEETLRHSLLQQGCLQIVNRLLISPMTDHQREALACYSALAETSIYHKYLLAPDVMLTAQLNVLLSRENNSVYNIGIYFLASVLFQLLTKDSLDEVGPMIIEDALATLISLSRHQLELIKNPALKSVRRVFARFKAELLAKADEATVAYVNSVCGAAEDGKKPQRNLTPQPASTGIQEKPSTPDDPTTLSRRTSREDLMSRHASRDRHSSRDPSPGQAVSRKASRESVGSAGSDKGSAGGGGRKRKKAT